MAEISEADIQGIDNATNVTGEPTGGSVENGQAIAIGLPTAAGKNWFRIPYERLHGFLHSLRGFGEMAEKARAGKNTKNLDSISNPYRVRAMPRFGHSPDGKILAIQFLTVEGFPVAVAMPREAAIAFADAVKRQATRPATAANA